MSIIRTNYQTALASVVENVTQVIVCLARHENLVLTEHIFREGLAQSFMTQHGLVVDPWYPLCGGLDESPSELWEDAREFAHQKIKARDNRWCPEHREAIGRGAPEQINIYRIA